MSKKTTPVGLITSILGSAAGSYFSEEISVGKIKLAQELQKFEPKLTEQQALDAVDGLFEIVDIGHDFAPKTPGRLTINNLNKKPDLTDAKKSDSLNVHGKSSLATHDNVDGGAGKGKNPSKKIDSQDPSNQHQNGGSSLHAGTNSKTATKPHGEAGNANPHVDSHSDINYNEVLGNIDPDIDLIFSSASESHKGITKVAHAYSKHAGRKPEIWGTTFGSNSEWHFQAEEHLKEIINSPENFQKILDPNIGITWLEKRLPDGRGARLNMDNTFKGFVD